MEKKQTKQISTRSLVIKTVLTAAVIMLFYFTAGAVVVMNDLSGPGAKLAQGCLIWLSVVAIMAYSELRSRSLKPLGFGGMAKGSAGKLLYFIPVLVIALSGLAGGIAVGDEGIPVILSNLFLTVGVGFSEELYFRGVICNRWRQKSAGTAILVSAILFGICHMLNVLGGADLGQTVLQICFAFFYGIVFGLIFIAADSVWPCVVLHFLHDFCAFIGAELTPEKNVILAVIQTLLLIGYAWIVWRRVKSSIPNILTVCRIAGEPGMTKGARYKKDV